MTLLRLVTNERTDRRRRLYSQRLSVRPSLRWSLTHRLCNWRSQTYKQVWCGGDAAYVKAKAIRAHVTTMASRMFHKSRQYERG